MDVHLVRTTVSECYGLSTDSDRFGAIALILQLVPVLSMLFLLTTAAGAGLWAARLEDEEQQEAENARGPSENYADDLV
jgi:hypothetical protein